MHKSLGRQGVFAIFGSAFIFPGSHAGTQSIHDGTDLLQVDVDTPKDPGVLLGGNTTENELVDPGSLLSGRLTLDAMTLGVKCVGTPCIYNGDCKDKLLPCCQNELFRLLNETADFLEKNNIEYYIMSGTMLGAVRDNDIIPWTADVDLAMRRPAMNQLLSSNVADVNFGPDEKSNKLLRACMKAAPHMPQREFTARDKTLPYIDIYDIDMWPDFAPYKGKFEGKDTAPIRGRQFPIPAKHEEILVDMYGDDWHTPVEGRGIADFHRIMKAREEEEKQKKAPLAVKHHSQPHSSSTADKSGSDDGHESEAGKLADDAPTAPAEKTSSVDVPTPVVESTEGVEPLAPTSWTQKLRDAWHMLTARLR